MTNFLLDLGQANNEIELNDLLVKHSQYEKEYVCACVVDRPLGYKIWIESLWEKFKNFADDNFLQEVRFNAYHQRTCEMYLANVLMSKGFNLVNQSNRETKKGGPDIKIELENKVIWIEVIAGNRGEKDNFVQERTGLRRSVISAVDDPKVLRITNCFNVKAEAFKKYLKKGIVSKNDIKLIAINGAGFDADLAAERLCMKAFYGFHEIVCNFETKKIENTSRSKICKKNGTNISVHPFIDSNFSEISGVIFWGDFIDICASSNFGSNLIIIHNGKAKNSLPPETFRFGTEYSPIIIDGKICKVEAKTWNN